MPPYATTKIHVASADGTQQQITDSLEAVTRYLLDNDPLRMATVLRWYLGGAKWELKMRSMLSPARWQTWHRVEDIP